MRRVGGKAVPQYFVMVGGGTTEHGASFARTAAKIPARRIPEALERLIAFYQREKEEGESAPAFFQRIDICASAASCGSAALHRSRRRAARLRRSRRDREFAPEVMDGECSA